MAGLPCVVWKVGTVSEEVTIATITISKALTDDDVIVNVDSGDLPLIDALGMLEFAKDSLIREAMGEAG